MTALKKDLSFWAFLRAVGNTIGHGFRELGRTMQDDVGFARAMVGVIALESSLGLGLFVCPLYGVGAIPSLLMVLWGWWTLIKEGDC